MFHRSVRWIITIACVAMLVGCATPRWPGSSQPSTAAGQHIGSGKASYYGNKHHNKRTANGERFNQRALTAAHRSLPFGSKVKVTNTHNGKSVIVRVNDRGPFVRGRIIDLSKAAFEQIGSTRSGIIQVRLERLD